MKQALIFIIIILSATQLNSQSLVNFDKYFADQTMRIDYFHIGEEFLTIDITYLNSLYP